MCIRDRRGHCSLHPTQRLRRFEPRASRSGLVPLRHAIGLAAAMGTSRLVLNMWVTRYCKHGDTSRGKDACNRHFCFFWRMTGSRMTIKEQACDGFPEWGWRTQKLEPIFDHTRNSSLEILSNANMLINFVNWQLLAIYFSLVVLFILLSIGSAY